jgi:hypothetical protein
VRDSLGWSLPGGPVGREVIEVELSADTDYVDLSISGESFAGVDLGSATFRGCEFNQVRFSNAVLQKVSLADCRFSGCDLSNADLGEATLDTVVVRDSKLLGASFAGAVLRSVQVMDTVCRLVSFFRASVRDTSFVECDLGEADFREATIRLSALVGSDLSSVSFVAADVRQLDIRGSVLDGSVSLTECRGFVVSTAQLVPLAAAVLRDVGATVNDDDVPEPEHLPGGGEIGRLQPIDTATAQRGLEEARARLRAADGPSGRLFD